MTGSLGGLLAAGAVWIGGLSSARGQSELVIAGIERTTTEQLRVAFSPPKDARGEYRIESAPSPRGPWSVLEGARLERIVGAYAFMVPLPAVRSPAYVRLVLEDREPPDLIWSSPQNGAFGVDPQAPIRFFLQDATGVDPSSIRLSINNADPIGTDDPRLDFESGLVTYTPGPGELLHALSQGAGPQGASAIQAVFGRWITVRVTASDMLGNVLTRTIDFRTQVETVLAGTVVLFGDALPLKLGEVQGEAFTFLYEGDLPALQAQDLLVSIDQDRPYKLEVSSVQALDPAQHQIQILAHSIPVSALFEQADIRIGAIIPPGDGAFPTATGGMIRIPLAGTVLCSSADAKIEVVSGELGFAIEPVLSVMVYDRGMTRLGGQVLGTFNWDVLVRAKVQEPGRFEGVVPLFLEEYVLEAFAGAVPVWARIALEIRATVWAQIDATGTVEVGLRDSRTVSFGAAVALWDERWPSMLANANGQPAEGRPAACDLDGPFAMVMSVEPRCTVKLETQGELTAHLRPYLDLDGRSQLDPLCYNWTQSAGVGVGLDLSGTHWYGSGNDNDGDSFGWGGNWGAEWRETLTHQERMCPEADVAFGMAPIPAGEFQMGDSFGGEGFWDELPVHGVFLGPFATDRYEVTKALWDEVYAWAVAHGYVFESLGSADGPDHPVCRVSWYDAVKWCNARSERAGLTPCYYTSVEQTAVYRAGQVDVANDWVRWGGDGYRLPTEAEWEKAARGGIAGNRFPWGDTIGPCRANYERCWEDLDDWDCFDLWSEDCHLGAGYSWGGPTAPVGTFPPNAYGLYDMAGNVWEWCWDWYDSAWYSRPEAWADHPIGPKKGTYRVTRGGAFINFTRGSGYLRCAQRSADTPASKYDNYGFRSVRGESALDSDGDGVRNWQDRCPFDPGKVEPGVCGCGVADIDTDGDETLDCLDPCPLDRDSDGDGTEDCLDDCPDDPAKVGPGQCGCGAADIDTDGDHVADCLEGCPEGVQWVDENGNSIADCDEVPPDMSWIPPGSFQMGAPVSEQDPAQSVFVSPFYIERHEVTKALWDEVYSWAIGHGYTFENRGEAKGSLHPIVEVDWHDALKWCNARSEKEGLTPCYYTSPSQGAVYRRGEIWMTKESVKRDADGYRLPTEAEWEKAARGGVEGSRFPRGNTITHTQANYRSWADFPFDVSPTQGYHPDYDDGGWPYTAPVGSFLPNGYGLYDMAGNVSEWCWDWYRRDEQGCESGGQGDAGADPWGPDWGLERVHRGGSWDRDSYTLQCAHRDSQYPDWAVGAIGLRCARSLMALDPKGDWDGDGVSNHADGCPLDAGKVAPGACGCGISELDRDRDGTVDCLDPCPEDPAKTVPGVCGCGVPDADTDGDAVPDCLEQADPPGMVLVPAGVFVMGDVFSEGSPTERPLHTVHISGFHMDRYEVTKGLWDDVYWWALEHGYGFENEDCGATTDRPVVDVSWYDAVKWCNARSEKEGLSPCYYTSAAQAGIYRSGQVDVGNAWVKWAANGYRLPTEAEWEKAARGGLVGKRFPWGDMISHDEASYDSFWENGHPRYTYDISRTEGPHPDCCGCCNPNEHIYTAPVGSFAPNGYGLYDMAGNVFEWCWDRLGSGWYARSEASAADTPGPDSGCGRVQRGGSCTYGAGSARCAAHLCSDMTFARDDSGFRCVRSYPALDPDGDLDRDGALNRDDLCPSDPNLIHPGICGCGFRSSEDRDGDGVVDCLDGCPDDPGKTAPGDCGCGHPDRDTDADTVLDCDDLCPGGDDRLDANGNGVPDACDPAFQINIALPRGERLVLRRIPAGAFLMGASPGERSSDVDESPAHTVAIDYDFYIGKYEVTQAQWLALMGSNPSTFPGDTSRPVERVSWEDARSFVAALNGHIVATDQGPLTVRLPSEAEWEYACRAGTRTRFSFGDSLTVGDNCEDDGVRGAFMWYCGNNSPSGTKPVRTRLPNDFGLFDMHGNVWEWCEDDYHSSYSGAPTDGSAWRGSPTASTRVVRGGYWGINAGGCRASARVGVTPSYRYSWFGFRVVAVR